MPKREVIYEGTYGDPRVETPYRIIREYGALNFIVEEQKFVDGKLCWIPVEMNELQKAITGQLIRHAGV